VTFSAKNWAQIATFTPNNMHQFVYQMCQRIGEIEPWGRGNPKVVHNIKIKMKKAFFTLFSLPSNISPNFSPQTTKIRGEGKTFLK